MSYFGTGKPILIINSIEWDLADVNVFYDYDWDKDIILHTSEVTGKITPVDKSQDTTKGRMTISLKFYDLSEADMTTFLSIRNQATIDVKIHSVNYPGVYTFVVTKCKPFAGGSLPYPIYDCAILELISQEYIDIKQVA